MNNQEIADKINALKFALPAIAGVHASVDEETGELSADIVAHRTFSQKDESERDGAVAEVESAVAALGLKLKRSGRGDSIDGNIYIYSVAAQ